MEKQIFVRIFVYGTLREGMRLNSCLAGAKRIATAHTAPNYKMLVSKEMGFPFLIETPVGEGAKVIGEIYDVTLETKESLDDLERGYTCKPIQLLNAPGAAAVYGYVLDDPKSRYWNHAQNPKWLKNEEITDFVVWWNEWQEQKKARIG